MNKYLKGVLLAGMALATASAFGQAQQPFDYYGVSYNRITMFEQTFTEEVEPRGFMLTAGRKDERGISLELRLGLGKDTATIGGNPDNQVGLDQLIGVYYKLYGNPGGVIPYLLIGYTKVKIEDQSQILNLSEDDTDFSYGVGFDYNLDVETTINIEYVNYFDNDDLTLEMVAIGFLKRY